MTTTGPAPAPGRPGFTLVELMVVLVLMGLLTALAVVSLAGVRQRVGLDEALQQLLAFDRSTREQAQRFDRSYQLLFDFGDSRLQRVDQTTQDKADALLSFPGVRMAQVRTARESFADGRLALACSALGVTPSYAVWLTPVSGSASSRGAGAWVVVAGLTGQSFRAANEQEVCDILQQAPASGPRPDHR